MVEFLLTIPKPGQATFGPLAPFRYLEGADGLECRQETMEAGDCRFVFLTREERPELFCSDEGGMFLYGDCYPKSGLDQFPERGKLTAARLYELQRAQGDRFLEFVKGSFAIVRWNAGALSPVIYTDPLNLRTIYYSSTPRGWIVASSLSALANQLAQNGTAPAIDYRAVVQRLLFDFTLGEETYLQGVQEVPPGAILTFDGERCRLDKWFDPWTSFSVAGPTLDRCDGAERLKQVLADNIALYTEGAEHTAVALTGGFDSRSIVALLEESAADYELFSYGREGSWDVKIPQAIADRLQFQYTPILLGQAYEAEFSKYAELAVRLGDGITEFSQANIAYVYSRFLQDKRSILTGLFGSELIKTPSSRGLFLDRNMIEILQADDPAPVVQRLCAELRAKELGFPVDEEALLTTIRQHPFISNDRPLPEKYFYYLLMVGIRKYFSKEIKIQKMLKKNLHPYFDVEFIAALLDTPYPWVYHFSQEKSLWKNLSIHHLYGSIIDHNPALSDVISTHGFRPRNLLSKSRLPLLAWEYLTHKKKISKASQLNFQRALSLTHIQREGSRLFDGCSLPSASLPVLRREAPKNFLQLSSLQRWMQTIGTSL